MNATCLRVILPAVLTGGLAAVPVLGGEDTPPVEKKDVLRSQGNLKQIGIAFHAFHDATTTLPVDLIMDGKPILSWRVVILPYIEEDNLYKQFKLDEPWDSEHNKKLIPKMPKIYSPIRVKAREGETFYQVFTGKSALFMPGKLLRIPASMPDGTSQTGLVFEAGEPVVWTKPADLTFDANKPLPKLGGLFDGEFNVVMCDGSVVRIKKGADEKELKKLIMPADGLVLDIDKLKK